MDDLSTTHAFSDLVGAIYDCALEPARWPATLTRLRTRLGFANALLGLNELPGGRLIRSVVVGIESPWLERLDEHTDDVLGVWGGAEVAYAQPMDKPAVASWVNPTLWDLTPTNRYLREWALPQGIVDCIVLPLVRDATGIGSLAMGRHGDAGPIGALEVQLAQLLLPHLQRAVTIGRLLEERPVAGEYAAVLNALHSPVFLVASDRTILFANPAAADMLHDGSALTATATSRGRRLSAATPRAARALAIAITRACAGDMELAEGSLAVPLPAGVDAYAGYILPLGRRSGQPMHEADAVAAVFVATPRAQPGGAGRMVAALFGLTAAEQRVFDAIAAGSTTAEFAKRTGVAPSTVRTHLLRIFQKTGTRRQSDLVQLAGALASPATLNVNLPRFSRAMGIGISSGD